jgi:hypothetical protein
MSTQWITGVIQATGNIAKIESEIRSCENLMVERQAQGLPIELETGALKTLQASLILCRNNLHQVLAATRDITDWQASNPDDPT